MYSMKRILFILSFISLISTFSFAQEANGGDDKPGSNSAEAFAIIPELEPEEVKDLSPGHSKLIFKTNVKSSRIFLNGNLQGLTPLTLLNLTSGYYLLRVEKAGYESKENFIYVDNGKAKTFYIEIQPDEETRKQEEAKATSQKSNAEAKETQPAAESEAALGDAK